MNKRTAFLHGTIILMCANAAAKILGAVFKIPLAYVLHEEGMAIYNTAFSVYIMMLSLIPGGFGFAVTKILGEYSALSNRERMPAVVRGMAVILAAGGILAGIIMCLFSEPLAIAMREPLSPGAIRSIAFAIFFVALSSSIKSYNEADAHYIPTALSQVTEAAIKLFIGLALAKCFQKISTLHAACGALLGVVIGEAFQAAFLFIAWKFNVHNLPKHRITHDEIKKICAVAIPLTLTGCASGALSMTEVAVIRSSLSKIVFSPQEAVHFLKAYQEYTNVFDTVTETLSLGTDGVRKLYGAFSGYAQTVFNLPVGIIATITAAATPLFSKAITLNLNNELENTVCKVLSSIYLLCFPAMLVCIFFSDEVLDFIFSNSFAGQMLCISAPAMFFLCTANMFIALLHLSGKIYEPFFAVMLSLVIKIVSTAILVGMPNINILGAGLASVISSFSLMLFTYVMVRKNFAIKPRIIKNIILPLFSSLLLVLTIKLTLSPLNSLISFKPAFVISAFLGVSVYAAVNYILRIKIT